MEHNLSEQIVTLLNEIAKENDITKYEIKIKKDWGKCEGFASVIVPVDLICDKCSMELIVKIAPSEEFRKKIPFEKVFDREVFLYNTVLPEFIKLQKDNNLPTGRIFEKYPICYKASLEYPNEVLIIENLAGEKNYKLWNKCLPMDKNHVELVLTEYAKLHSLSFVLRRKNAPKLKSFAENTKDVYMDIIQNCGTSEIIKNLVQRVLDWLLIENESKLVEKLTDFQHDVIEIMCDLININACGEYGVVGHGDNWTNNILFKYQSQNGTSRPIDVKFIDWQLSRYGSPVLDLSYFLYSCGSKEILADLDNLLKIYHNSLSTALKDFNLNIEDMFPWSVLKDHWKKFSMFGLGMSFLVVHVAVMADDETPNIDSDQSSDDFLKTFEKSSVNDKEYFKRMKYILNHFVENNFL